MTHPRPRILLVDDEPMILDALTRLLRHEFEIRTAPSGAEALETVLSDEPFAVVMADMRMPGMLGSALLAHLRKIAPGTTRMLLTGQTEIEAAIAAVNEGNIFRFLRKPCPPDEVLGSMRAAAEQHRLVTAEKELLEKTLRGSVQALVETLALVNPSVFGTATRVKRLVLQLAQALGLEDVWQIEVAAMVAQLGAVTLPAAVADRISHPAALSRAEQAMIARVPEFTERLLAHIPRLELVRAIVRQQLKNFDGTGSPGDGVAGDQIPIGARLLRVAFEFDVLESAGLEPRDALAQLCACRGVFDARVLEALARVLEQGSAVDAVEEVSRGELHPGMIFAADVRLKSGGLLVARGHEASESLIERLHNFADEFSGYAFLVRRAPVAASKAEAA